MKNLKLGVAVLALGVASSAVAQTTTNKWAIGVGAHGVNHTAVNGSGKVGDVFKTLVDSKEGLYRVGNYEITPPLSKLTVARNINKSFVADFQATVGNIGNGRFENSSKSFFMQAGLGLQYKFQALLNNENSWFDPYARVGANYLRHDYNTVVKFPSNDIDGKAYPSFRSDGATDKQIINHFTTAVGLGSNFWITKNFGLNIQGDYVNTPFDKSDVSNFWQASASIMFRFGQTDTDKDGVYDNEDKCPTVAGPKENGGCPWPDTDKDGVLDKDDKCPSVAGPSENAGCPWPDTDKDGTLDKDDKCPTVAGPKDNAGCPFPDTDKDGVLDKDDKCPTVFGVKENNGCPKAPDHKLVAEEVSNVAKGVFFDLGKATIKKESFDDLDAAAALIKKGNGTFLVEGHTDKKGKDAANLLLSQRRAKAVVLALEERGVAASQLKSKGMGSKFATVAAKASDAERMSDRKVIFTHIAAGNEWDAIEKHDLVEKAVKAVKSTKKTSKKK
jgi:OmpA-OmpF porin, OOP family